MADLFQIVSIDKLASRKAAVFPITNDTGKPGGGSRYEIVRDTLKINPPKANQIASVSDRRFGGGRVVGETHENGTIDMELYVNGGTANPNDSVNAAEAVVAQLQSARRGRYLEFRPDGALSSTYYELRGPGPWDNQYKWIEFQGNRTIHTKLTFQTAPLTLGDPMDIYEPFDTDTRASNWTYLQGTSASMNYQTATATGWRGTGRITWSAGLGSGIVSALSAANGYKYGDVQVGMQVMSSDTTPTGGSSTTYIGAILAAKDSANYLSTRLYWTGTTWALRVLKTVNGTVTGLANTATFAIANSTRYWILSRLEGNVFTVELWTSMPTSAGTPAQSLSYTLTGSEITQFGTGSAGGSVGWTGGGLQGTSTGWSVEAWRAEPFTYSTSAMPATIDLGGTVPGTAPALADVTIKGAGAGPWALLGWLGRSSAARIADEARTPTTPHTPFGILDSAGVTTSSPAGWAATADANTYNGTFQLSPTLVPTSTYTWSWLIDPSVVVPDEFQDTIMLEVYTRLRLDSTMVSPRLFPSLQPSANVALPSLFPVEFGTLGRALYNVPIAGTNQVWRVVRAGTFIVPAEAFGQLYRLSFDLTFAAGSVGTLGVDWAAVVPSKQRAAGATGKPHDGSYPDFFRGVNYAERLDASLRGYAWLDDAVNGVPGANFVTPRMGPSPGLGGQLVEVAPGPVSFFLYGSSEVPDDPVSNSNNESDVFPGSVNVHWSVWPRYFLGRS